LIWDPTVAEKKCLGELHSGSAGLAQHPAKLQPMNGSSPSPLSHYHHVAHALVSSSPSHPSVSLTHAETRPCARRVRPWWELSAAGQGWRGRARGAGGE
jgi:hypothetical protein